MRKYEDPKAHEMGTWEDMTRRSFQDLTVINGKRIIEWAHMSVLLTESLAVFLSFCHVARNYDNVFKI